MPIEGMSGPYWRAIDRRGGGGSPWNDESATLILPLSTIHTVGYDDETIGSQRFADAVHAFIALILRFPALERNEFIGEFDALPWEYWAAYYNIWDYLASRLTLLNLGPFFESMKRKYALFDHPSSPRHGLGVGGPHYRPLPN
jgi:hypothetical protein